jgi:hypothetical protein
MKCVDRVSATSHTNDEISKLVISTPPPIPPTSLLPLHTRARALLQSTCNSSNTEITGRAAERASIPFLTNFSDDGQKFLECSWPVDLRFPGNRQDCFGQHYHS